MPQIKIYSAEKVDKPFRELAMRRFGYNKGAISKAAEEALLRWINSISTIDSILSKLVEKVKSDDRILAVILFGSYARKEANFRDIDVGLLISKAGNTLEVYSDYTAIMGGENHIDLSIINSLPIDVQSSIFNDAVVLYCADSDALYDYTIGIIKNSADVRHIIREALKTV